VYEWFQDGQSVGLGTKVELDHWTAEGVMENVTLGEVLCYEDPSEDEKRKIAWAKQAAS
jgi:hypothetical protein